MVRNDQFSAENAIHANILSLKHLKAISTYPKHFQSLPLSFDKLFHEDLPLPHLLFAKADDVAGF